MLAQTQSLEPQPAVGARSLPPLLYAGRGIAADLLSTVIFIAVFAVTKNVYAATAVGIGAGAVQVSYLLLRRRPVAAMQWLSLFLVVAFGAASLLTNDPRFLMAKPSLIYTAVGVVMLRRGWMVRYMPPGSMEQAGDVATVFGYLWAGLMFLTAILNLVIAATVSFAAWASFVSLFPIFSKLGLFGVQYIVTRRIVMRRSGAQSAGLFTHD